MTPSITRGISLVFFHHQWHTDLSIYLLQYKICAKFTHILTIKLQIFFGSLGMLIKDFLTFLPTIYFTGRSKVSAPFLNTIQLLCERLKL